MMQESIMLPNTKGKEILLVLLGLTVVIISVSRMMSVDDKLLLFHQNELAGRIESKEYIKGVTRITLLGRDGEHWEFLALDKESYPENLYSFLKVCDSIYKAPDGDSIHLYRNGQVHSWRIAR